MAGAKARGLDRTFQEFCRDVRKQTSHSTREARGRCGLRRQRQVDRLRQSVGVSVAGVFFAKIRYQVGALRSGQHEGVTFHRIPLSLG